MGVGPFEPYPADVGEIDRLAGVLRGTGAPLTTLRSDVMRQANRADTDSFGLSDGVYRAVQPSKTTGALLQEAGTCAGRAMTIWSTRVGAYNDTMHTLNGLWEIAKANDFGLSDASPAATSSAGTDGLAAARSAALDVLVREQGRAKRRLDDDAHTVAAILDAGPSAQGPQVMLVDSGDDGIDPETGLHWSDPGSRAYHERQDRIENYEGPGINWSGAFKFLFMDPAECFGDDASVGGCGLEAGALLPWGKWLKALKLGKAGKHVDDVPDPPAVHEGKQGKHIPGHNNYQPGKSILEADPDELAKKAGTGTPVGKVPRGEPGSKEIVDYGHPIGKYVNPQTGETLETTRATIHYAKDGIHIVPAYPK